MFKWNKCVQKMIDLIEDNLTNDVTLEKLSKELHYSSYYCTRQFHQYVGISLRNYIRLRKLSAAALCLRDTTHRMIDIAFKYGFSSQEAFSRSFTKVFGISPNKYRKMPHPLPLFVKRNTYNPYLLGIKRDIDKNFAKEVKVNIQVIPKHQFIGLIDYNVSKYYDFWERQEKIYGRDCYKVSGILESIKSYNGVVGGWYKGGYIYGIEVPWDKQFHVADYFEKIVFPESLYVIFHYPPYEYNKDESLVFNLLDKKIKSWSPIDYGYQYHDLNPIYQRHQPETYGQAICKPIKMIKNKKNG